MNRRGAIAAGVLVVLVAIALVLLRGPRDEEGAATVPPAGAMTTVAPAPTPSESATAVAGGSAPLPSPAFPPILDWPALGRDDFGCLLERAGHRHARWNCSSAATGAPLANPCDDEFLYAGPDLPADAVARVSPLLASAELHWDAGHLYAFTLRAKPGVSADELRTEFRLPNVAPNGIRGFEVRECEPGTSCVVVDVADRLDCAGRQPD